MGVDHSKLLEKQRAEIRYLEEKLAKARAIQVLERRSAVTRERTRLEEREDKKSSIILKEKLRQEDRDYMNRSLVMLERIEKEKKDAMKLREEAKNDAYLLELQHQWTENDKQRKLKMYEIEKNISLERDAHYMKYQLLHELLQSCRDSPDIKDILKTSMDSMSHSFRGDNC